MQFKPFDCKWTKSWGQVTIWALDVDEMYAVGRERPMVVVHNPMAEFPIEEMLLPAFEEYVCTAQVDRWELTRKPGAFTASSPKS